GTASFVSLPYDGFTARGEYVWEATHPVPLVAWYGAGIVASGYVLAAVRDLEEPDGRRLRAVLEPADAALVPAAFTTGVPDTREGRLEAYGTDEIRFSIDAPRDGLVVLNEVM